MQHDYSQKRNQFQTIGTSRPKIMPIEWIFGYVPFLGLKFWVPFCSNSNTITFDSKVYIWNNLSGVKFIVIGFTFRY